MSERAAVSILLRIGVAFAFLFPAVSAVFDPYSWIGFFPPFILAYVPTEESQLILLHVFGASEVVIALWLLSGWRIFVPSILAAAYLLAIVCLNTPQFLITFRDLSIMFMALALAAMSARRAPSIA